MGKQAAQKGKGRKRGVTKAIMKTLTPINAHLGGRAVTGSLFTTNGFIKKKFDHDCFEKQNRQLMQLYAESKSHALKVLQPKYQNSQG